MSNVWFSWSKSVDGDDRGMESTAGGGFEHGIDDSQISTLYSEGEDYTDDDYTEEETKEKPAPAKFEPFQGTARSASKKNVLDVDQESGSWACRLYKHEKLQQEIDSARLDGQSPREAILTTLKSMGVKVFIVAYGHGDLADVVASVRRIVSVVAQESRMRPQFNSRVFQRCLLFQDHQGRLFNLVLAPSCVGPVADFHKGLNNFSGWQAMVGLTILVRSLRCASDVKDIGHLNPTYLTLILGLILTQEIAYAWLNTAMLVRAIPSISAYSLNMRIGSDWLRKGTLLAFTIAGTTQGHLQRILILIALSMTCILFLANLGARAWYYLRWKPLGYNGPFANVIAFVLAAGTGIVAPYMGQREVEVGGKAALESVLSSALLVAIFFVLSAMAEVKKFIVLGLETCDQQGVDYAVGIWWAVTLVVAIFQVRSIKPPDQFPKDEEPLLVQDDKSPVGYRVPNLPDFAIDPLLAKDGSHACTMAVETLLGILMALLVGGGIVWLALTKQFDSLSFKTLF